MTKIVAHAFKICMLTILCLQFTQCASKQEKQAGPSLIDSLQIKGQPKSIQLVRYQLDSLDQYEVKRLQHLETISFNETGNLKDHNSKSFDLTNPDGVKTEENEKFSMQFACFHGDISEYILNLLSKIATDTTMLVSGNFDDLLKFKFDKQGNWVSIYHRCYSPEPLPIQYERILDFDGTGAQSKPSLITVNGTDIFNKENLNIVDYAILKGWSAGTFDIKNGYGKYSEEGGDGRAEFEIAQFNAASGERIMATNKIQFTAVVPSQTSGTLPSFSIYKNNRWEDVTETVFPQLDEKVFMPSGYEGEKPPSYFLLPKVGLTIKYIIDPAYCEFCKNLDASDMNYAVYKEKCEPYFNSIKKEISIKFDKASGKFRID